jgi:hypothetical protein
LRAYQIRFGDSVTRPSRTIRLPKRFLGRGLAALFPPQAEQGGLVAAHDDAGIGAADEVAAAKALRNVANWL